jgi:hypothetical protein
MPIGLEIVGFAFATVSIGEIMISKAAEYGGKGGAQKVYDGVATQYAQLKALREDILINQFISEEDKAQLDESIKK